MTQERLFASFMLDRQQGLEIALQAEQVVEATPVTSPIQSLPSSVDFLEGLMHLRDDVIAVINLKKRLGLTDTSYGDDAKVAVIQLGRKQYGLLFDDIKDVLRIQSSAVEQIDRFLMDDDGIITDLIKFDNGRRTLELLDIERLFPGGISVDDDNRSQNSQVADSSQGRQYSSYVVFSSAGQEYGVPVEEAREISFISDIDEMFKSGVIEGALQLRGNTIPVLSGAHLLGNREKAGETDEASRVLIMHLEELSFGVIVDQIREIILVADDEILTMPNSESRHVRGVYQHENGRNIMLINVANLIDSQREKIKNIGRINNDHEQEAVAAESAAHHVITENCYLVFSIGRNFAIELKDVQEIIESSDVMNVPEGYGLIDGIINLRGVIVPVLNLHSFYNSCKQSPSGQQVKLIIGRANGQRVAMIVDEIKTIYKQEEFHTTPSLKPELQDKRDTLDRLIEFVGDSGVSEHVLVVNVENIITNHLGILDAPTSTTLEINEDESTPEDQVA